MSKDIEGISAQTLGEYKELQGHILRAEWLKEKPEEEVVESEMFYRAVYPEIRKVSKRTTEEIANLREMRDLR